MATSPPASELRQQFGDIDIYVFDQLLRGRILGGMRVLDAGCGGGRNLVYLLREGFDVFGVDADPRAVDAVRKLASSSKSNAENFRVEPVEAMSFPDHFADVVLSSAVLHFARDERHFDSMVWEMWRVLRPDGMLFCRLASTIGIERQVQLLEGRRFLLPDGSTRFLVDEEMLMTRTETLGGQLLDPLKTTVVQGQRSMTTWVIRKAA